MSKHPSMVLPWPIVWEGVCLIAEREGCRLTAYLCPAGKWTIGWGETKGVKQGMVWTQEQADKVFCERLYEFTNAVKKLLTTDTTELQLAAMVSLAYNIGIGSSNPNLPGGFTRSSVLRYHNQKLFESAAKAFLMWNKVTKNGKLVVENGLTIRRGIESEMYLRGLPVMDAVVNIDPIDIPEPAKDCEKPEPIIKSESAQAGTAIAATSAAVGVAEIVNELEPAVSMVTTILRYGTVALVIVGLIAGGIVIYRAWKRRRG